MALPAAILALAELTPIEDILLPILRAGLPGVAVQSLINTAQTFPLVMPRRMPQFGVWEGDTRFTDSADVVVHTFADGVDADEDAAILSEAVRVVLRNAYLNHVTVPGKGHITGVGMTSAPRKATDWATATGPVQYADLPTGVVRYEALFRVTVRKSPTPPYSP